jgi:hypothetical protein
LACPAVAAKHELQVFDVNVTVPLCGLQVIEGVIAQGAEQGLIAPGDDLIVEDVHLAVLVEVAFQGLDGDNGVAH